jgi:antirestriction protein
MPNIYVASLADYNAGRLHGRWIDAAQDPEDIWAEVQAMLKESKEPIAEEWAIHDYDDFGGLRLGEYESFEKVSLIANMMEDHSPEIVAAYLSENEDAPLGDISEYYCGQWDSEKAYAYEYVEECGWGGISVPEELQNYLDWDAIVRDLFEHGEYYSARAGAPDYGVHVFRSSCG